MGNINLKQLEVFAAVVEYGSFTEAANQLYLAQSTVSGHIRTLEAALHTLLFRRGAKKSSALTDEGKRVYQMAREVLDKCSNLENEMVEEKRSELLIGASTAPSYQLVPSYVAAFLRRRPDCCVSLKYGDSELVQRMLLDREVQLGFVGSTDNRRELSYERIATDRLVLITPNNECYAAMKSEGKLGRELLSEPLLSREPGSGTQKMVDNYLSGIGMPSNAPRVSAYVSNPVSLQKLVAEGVGVAVLSYLTARERVAAGEILAFDLEEFPVERDIYIAWRKRGDLSGSAKEFVFLVREAVKSANGTAVQ